MLEPSGKILAVDVIAQALQLGQWVGSETCHEVILVTEYSPSVQRRIGDTIPAEAVSSESTMT